MTDAAKPGWYTISNEGLAPECVFRHPNGRLYRLSGNLPFLPPGWTLGPRVEDLIRDAELYRWVRSGNRTIRDAELVYDLMDRAVSEQAFDAAIAAEIAREKAKPEPEPDHSPTWWEGYWAHASGWGLPDGHTKQYQAGWKHRRMIMENEHD